MTMCLCNSFQTQ